MACQSAQIHTHRKRLRCRYWRFRHFYVRWLSVPMMYFFSRISLVTVLALPGPSSAFGDELPVAQASAVDPLAQCQALVSSLPKRVPEIRNLAPVIAEHATDDRDYCHTDLASCQIRTIEMPGLSLSLLVRRATQEASPLSAQISDSRWKLLGGIRVGSAVRDLEKLYGVAFPRNAATFKICGECTCLTVAQVGGIVTKLDIDCQSCI